VLVAITIAGVSEALVLGTRLGVAPETILDVLSRGLAANRVMDLRRANFLNHAFSPGFKVDLHHKDLDIALAGGGQANPAPLALAASKRVIVESADWDSAEAFARQGEIISPVFTSRDAMEGAGAFAEKRAPAWRGE